MRDKIEELEKERETAMDLAQEKISAKYDLLIAEEKVRRAKDKLNKIEGSVYVPKPSSPTPSKREDISEEDAWNGNDSGRSW